MSETNPGYSDDQHAGEVGSRRATIGTATDPESVNVPPTRPGAAENAYEAEARRTPHETFVPDTLEPDDRTDAIRARAAEEEALSGGGGTRGRLPESTTPYQTGDGGTATGHRARHPRRHGWEDLDEEERVRESIRETRRELGDTVSALARKADVKSRAADAAGSARQRAGEMAATAKAKAAGITGTAKSKAGTAKSRAGEVPGATKGAAAEVSGRALQLKDRAGPAQKRTLLLMALTAAVAAVLVTRARRDRSISRTRTGRSAGRTWAGRPIGRAWTHRPASRGWTRRSAGRAWTPRSISRALTGRPISPDWTDRVVSWVWTGSVTPDWTGRPVRRRSTHRARWYFQGF